MTNDNPDPNQVTDTSDKDLDDLIRAQQSGSQEQIQDLINKARAESTNTVIELGKTRRRLQEERRRIVLEAFKQDPNSIEAKSLYVQFLDSQIRDIEDVMLNPSVKASEDKAYEQYSEWCKQVATLSSAALVLVGGFAGALFENADGKWLLLPSWLFLLLAIVGALSYMKMFPVSTFKALGILDNPYIEDSESTLSKKVSQNNNQPSKLERAYLRVVALLSLIQQWLRALCSVLFVLGLVCFLIFASVNIFGAQPENPDSQPASQKIINSDK